MICSNCGKEIARGAVFCSSCGTKAPEVEAPVETPVPVEKAVENTNSEDNDATSTTVFYEYDEAKLTKEEYQEYLKELNGSDTLQTIEDLKTENQNLNEQVSMLTECLLEMSETVYA